MPEEVQAKPAAVGRPDKETDEKTQEEEAPEEEKAEEGDEGEEEMEKSQDSISSFQNLTSPEGVLMLFLAGIFDFFHIICAGLIFFFGIGLLMSKIVYTIALISIGGCWALFRSGAVPTKGKDDKLTETTKKQLGGFLKRHWGKLGAKFIPLIGDLIPFWTITVYKELTSES